MLFFTANKYLKILLFITFLLHGYKGTENILSSSVLTVYRKDEKKPIYRSPILCDVVRVSREDYLEDGRVLWAARLPALISKSVNELEYRQFNYDALMKFKSQLARWIHKRLSHNFTNASMTQHYTIMLSSIERDSGLLDYTRMNDKVRTFDDALSELIEEHTVFRWTKFQPPEDEVNLQDACTFREDARNCRDCSSVGGLRSQDIYRVAI